MCTTIEHLLQDVQSLRSDEQEETVVGYLLSEVEKMIHDGKLAVNRSHKQDKLTRLFEIQFSDYTPFTIHTICKSGAAHIKCYENCTGSRARATVNQIETVCKKLKWNIETDRVGGRCIHNMKIGCFIQKEATP